MAFLLSYSCRRLFGSDHNQTPKMILLGFLAVLIGARKSNVADVVLSYTRYELPYPR